MKVSGFYLAAAGVTLVLLFGWIGLARVQGVPTTVPDRQIDIVSVDEN